VRIFVANDRVKRSTDLCKRECVRGRAVEDEEDFAIRFKNFTHQIAGTLRPSIVAIGCGCSRIRFLEYGPRLRTNRGGIVAREFMAIIRRTLHEGFATRHFSAEQM
jgi:hypothetical protein